LWIINTTNKPTEEGNLKRVPFFISSQINNLTKREHLMKILKFTEFNESVVNEDELPPLPDLGAMGGAPADGAAPEGEPAAPAAAKKYVFIFITADKDWAAEYPTGGGIKKYKRYQVNSADLDKWIEEKKLTSRAEEIKDSLTGEKEMEKDLFFTLKQGLRDKSLEYKELGEIDVEYDSDNTPYTDNLDVTFLKAAKTEKETKKEEEDKKEENSETIQPTANDQA
jgi:hypothetical protein